MKDICKNCGGWKGLHHFETDACPLNGVEAPIGRKQKYHSNQFFEQSEVKPYDSFEEMFVDMEYKVSILRAALICMIDATSDDDTQEIGGKPLEKAIELANKALESTND